MQSANISTLNIALTARSLIAKIAVRSGEAVNIPTTSRITVLGPFPVVVPVVPAVLSPPMLIVKTSTI